MRIAVEGEPGAFSGAAIRAHFGSEQVICVPCESFELVFKAVAGDTCDLGFIPIENSLAGSIHQNYDLLLRNDLWVVGEHNLRVSHCLIAFPGTELKDIKKVISHPQALAQCEGYLHALAGITVEPVYDTAGSVKMVRDQGDPHVAAIASRRAAELEGMAILADTTGDNPAHYTRS